MITKIVAYQPGVLQAGYPKRRSVASCWCRTGPKQHKSRGFLSVLASAGRAVLWRRTSSAIAQVRSGVFCFAQWRYQWWECKKPPLALKLDWRPSHDAFHKVPLFFRSSPRNSSKNRRGR